MKGVTLNLALGGVAPGGEPTDGGAKTSYLEVAPYGDEKGGVFVVGPDVAAVLDRSSDAFREPSLLSGQQSSTFSKIEIKGPANLQLVTLERAAHGAWRIPSGVPGAPLRAGADAVDGLLRAMYELKADPFVPDSTPVDPSKGGTIEITQLNGEKLIVQFGGPCPADAKLVVAQAKTTPPSTGCVPSVVTERVAAPASMYIDGRAFGLLPGTESAKISEIESIVIEAGGAKIIDAERRGDGLHLRVPSDEQIDKEATDRYLARLSAIAGTLVPGGDPAALGLSPPAGKVTIRRRVDRLTLGGTSGDGGGEDWDQVVELSAPMPEDPAVKDGPQVVYVRRLDDGAILRVPLEVAQPVRLTAAQELRNPNLLSLTPESIVRAHVKPAAEGGYEVAKKSGTWELVSPKGLGADPSSVSAVTATLASLLCQRWAAEKDDGSFGFATPSVVIDLEREVKVTGDAGAEATTFTIELGKESNDATGGVYARVRGRDPICVLPIGKRDALLRAPVDFRNVGFDPLQTPRLVVSRAARSRTVVYSDATKTWSDASDAGSHMVARKLADAIRGLRAEGLVHLGPARPEEGFDAPTLSIEGFDAATTKKKKLVVGGIGKLGDTPIYYVRVEALDATWAVLRGDVDAIVALP
ncbi:MAG: DUF4340 domain-containing protein [Deltaproteobacteria bacterium]|nr:DUF4340 domain-containing protein [Deltaproteobacteria bacterium]